MRLKANRPAPDDLMESFIADERVERARQLLAAVADDPLDVRSAVVDVLADLMHFARAYYIPFDEALDTARMHFEAETNL